MKSNIVQLIETALKNLYKKNIIITPTNFEKEFYPLLSKSDILLEDYEDFLYLVSSLTQKENEIFEKDDKTTLNLAKIFNNRPTEQDLKLFLKHLIYFMSPSIDSLENNYNEIIFDIANKPKSLFKDETIRVLKKHTKERIESDKSLFNEKITDVKLLVDFFEKHLKNVILQHDTTKDEVLEIKDDLENLKLSSSSQEELKHFQDEMKKIVNKFETTLEKSNNQLNKSQAQSIDLYEQIELLQQNLNKAEEEKSIDFLTGVLTRRAYIDELDRIENEYNVFDSYYAIVFYDIDHFKKINDKYGHDSGDVVLTKFATILKKLTRTGDIISRYGGEEFVALVHYSNEAEIITYLQRVKNIIINNKFISNNNKIDVRFSAGVTFRKKYESYDDAMKKADELLYFAKEEGRNRIVIDNNKIL